MKFLENSLSMLLVLTVAAFCWTVVQADTWDETANGGGDAGDFPAGDFQAAPDNSILYDAITGNNFDGIDAYLITVTDASSFNITDASGDVSDTQAFLWDMGGNGLMANDDDPTHVGDGDFSFGFGDALTHPVNPNTGQQDIVGTPATLSDGDTVVLAIGAFGDTAEGDAGTVFLDDAGDFISLRGPSGSNFTGYNAGGAGNYNVQLTGCQLGVVGGKDCIIGDLNGDEMVTLLDVNPFVAAILKGVFLCEADINEDGAVDLVDVNPFVVLLTGGG